MLLESITVTKLPDKTTYFYGDKLILDGMTVSANFVSDTDPASANIDINNCNVIGYDSKKLGEQALKVSYGGAETTFPITVAYSLSKAKVTCKDVEYTGEKAVNAIKVRGYETGIDLIEGKDYEVEYIGDHTSVGTKTVKIIGKGNYVGEETATYSITAKNLSYIQNLDIKVSDMAYTGNPCTPEVTVSYGTKTLTPDDYTVTYTNNTNAGRATVRINGKNNYKGSATTSFTIQQKSLQSAVLTLDKEIYEYNGSVIIPVESVTLDGQKLVKDVDYSVTYNNNYNAGTASVTIKGIGNYAGALSKEFAIAVLPGSEHNLSGYIYKVVDGSQVAFKGLSSKSTKTVSIPATVLIGGKKFKVTAIADKAFSGAKATKITIGTNVTKIGKQAFKNTKKLTKLTIKSKKIKSVGAAAFKGINAKAQIKVPKTKLSAYKKLFKNKGQSKKVKIVK